jgi:hypothetical protein
MSIGHDSTLDGLQPFTLIIVYKNEWSTIGTQFPIAKHDVSLPDQEWALTFADADPNDPSQQQQHNYNGSGPYRPLQVPGVWSVSTLRGYVSGGNDTVSLQRWGADENSSGRTAKSTSTTVTLGARWADEGAGSVQDHWNGVMCEVLLYSVDLDESTRRDAQNYLFHRWVDHTTIYLDDQETGLENETWTQYLNGQFPVEYHAGVRHESLSPGDASNARFEVRDLDIEGERSARRSENKRNSVSSGDEDRTDNVVVHIPENGEIRFQDEDTDTAKSLLDEHIVIQHSPPHGNEEHSETFETTDDTFDGIGFVTDFPFK